MCWSSGNDGLGRSPTQLLEIATALMARQVGLKGPNDPIDTTTPQGRLFFNLFASLAEFEREGMRERTPAGLAAARARGREGGRPIGSRAATASPRSPPGYKPAILLAILSMKIYYCLS
jgi:DNA invertase Pin-like site-specific DNA recombinase